MTKEELLADIAQKQTATNMTNSSFCIPIAGSSPTFTVTWNHNAPTAVLVWVYGGKVVFSYGPNGGNNNPTVFLDSQDGQNGYNSKTVTLTGSSVAVDLQDYISNPGPSGVTMVGVSW